MEKHNTILKVIIKSEEPLDASGLAFYFNKYGYKIAEASGDKFYVDNVEVLNSEGCLHCKGGFQINTSNYEPTVNIVGEKLNIIGCGSSVNINYCPMCGRKLKTE